VSVIAYLATTATLARNATKLQDSSLMKDKYANSAVLDVQLALQ
jgi:hypothetical protein